MARWTRHHGRAIGAAVVGCLIAFRASYAQQGEAQVEVPKAEQATAEQSAEPGKQETRPDLPAPRLPEPRGARRLSPQYPIWIDPKEKAVLVDGQICLREGMLEMFACTRNTKEHESIVSAQTKAYLVHAGLLSLGAEAGHPVRFQPKVEPPTGTEIEVFVWWQDMQGKEHKVRAQEWIRDFHTKKEMTYPFVFGGSLFSIDSESGKRQYQAEGGDFVCVSNFSTAMLDIPVESSQSNEELVFEAFTERIPPLGAPVRLIFKPKLASQKPSADRNSQPNEKQPNEKQPTG